MHIVHCCVISHISVTFLALVSGFVLGFKNCKLTIELFNPKTGGGVELENGFKIYRRGGFMFSDYNNASLVL